ncbi:MAG: hypothetical protein ACLUR5_01240 [Eubacterium ventriosum]
MAVNRTKMKPLKYAKRDAIGYACKFMYDSSCNMVDIDISVLHISAYERAGFNEKSKS